MAPPNPMMGALHKLIGSSGAMSWWCRWPTQEGEGQSCWSVGWWQFILVVVCCGCVCVVAHGCVVKSRVIEHGVPKPLADFGPIFKHDNVSKCSL